MYIYTYLIGGLEPWNFMTFHSVGNVIIPTDFHSIIFQDGFSTTNQTTMSNSLGGNTLRWKIKRGNCRKITFIYSELSHSKLHFFGGFPVAMFDDTGGEKYQLCSQVGIHFLWSSGMLDVNNVNERFGTYPLVMTNIAMENPNHKWRYQWENHL